MVHIFGVGDLLNNENFLPCRKKLIPLEIFAPKDEH